MSAPRDDRELHDGLDRLLREALPDDLPAEVEARMAGRIRAFLFSRRSQARADEGAPEIPDGLVSRFVGWSPARLAVAAAATLLLTAGLGLQAGAAAGSGAVDGPLRRINLSVSLFRALQHVSSLRCSGMPDAALETPATLAESVYRRWVPVSAHAGASGDLLATYRSAETAVDYEFVLDGATLLPREVRRREGGARASEATCAWTTTPAGRRDEPR